jgi:hypothetical protein
MTMKQTPYDLYSATQLILHPGSAYRSQPLALASEIVGIVIGGEGRSNASR